MKRMHWLSVAVFGMAVGALTASAQAAKSAPPAAAPADSNASLVKPHGGKVWVQRDAFPASEGERLGAYLASSPPAGEIVRKDKDGPWMMNYLAVFKKPSVKGSITVQFFEKGSPKEIVDSYSPNNESEALVFQAAYDLSEDKGFNKGHSYVIKVGQLLKNKFVVYASGEFSLK